MKYLSQLLFVIIFSNIATAQYFISNDAPKNKVGFPYHKDHFKLKGPLKSYSETYKSYYFNELGFLTKETHSSGLSGGSSKEYIYDSNNNLIQMKSTSYGDTMVYDLILDSKKRVIKKAYGSHGVTYEYDKKGNLLKEDDKRQVIRYRYDEKGRVVERTTTSKTVNTITKFTYIIEGDFLKITTKKDDIDGTEVFSHDSYFKNGIYFGYEKELEIEFDAFGNKTSQIGRNYVKEIVAQYSYYENADALTNSETKTTSNCSSGDCQNGWGVKTIDGETYEGFWENGQRTGFGVYTWENSTYNGEWKNNTMEGFGIYQVGKNTWIGEWKNGGLEGLAYISTPEGKKAGIYKVNNLIEEYPNEVTGNETGCVSGDCYDKYGKIKWENGSSFEGFFKNGQIYLGLYIVPEGSDYYFGYFDEEIKYGNFGLYHFNNGSQYVGQWNDGLYNGKGYFIGDNGTVLKGIYKDGDLFEEY